MEDGKLRNCCGRHYCRLCYEGTGNCPGCHLITVGVDRGVLHQASKDKRNAKNKKAPAAPVVRDGEECRSCLRRVSGHSCCRCARSESALTAVILLYLALLNLGAMVVEREGALEKDMRKFCSPFQSPRVHDKGILL